MTSFILILFFAVIVEVFGDFHDVTITFTSDGYESSVSYAILPEDPLHGEFVWVDPPPLSASDGSVASFSYEIAFPEGVYYVRRSDPYGDGGGSVSVIGTDGKVYLNQTLDFGFLDYDWFVIGEPSNVLHVSFETYCDMSPFESSWTLYLPAYSAYLFDQPIQCVSPNETIVVDTVMYEGLIRVDMVDTAGDGLSRADIPWFMSVSFSPYLADSDTSIEDNVLFLPYEIEGIQGDQDSTTHEVLASLVYRRNETTANHTLLISSVCNCYYCEGEVFLVNEDGTDTTLLLEVDCQAVYDAMRLPGEEDYQIYGFCSDDGGMCAMVFWTSTWQYVRHVDLEEFSIVAPVPEGGTVRVEVTDQYGIGRLDIQVVDVIEETDYMLVSTGGSYTLKGYFEILIEEFYSDPTETTYFESETGSDSDSSISVGLVLSEDIRYFDFATCVPLSMTEGVSYEIDNSTPQTPSEPLSVPYTIHREYIVSVSTDPMYRDAAWAFFDDQYSPVMWSLETNLGDSYCTSTATSAPVLIPDSLAFKFSEAGETMICHVLLDPGQTYRLMRLDLWRDGGISVRIQDAETGRLVKRFDPYEYAGIDDDWHTVDFTLDVEDECSWPAEGCVGDVMACLSCGARVYDLSKKEFMTDGFCLDGESFTTQCFSSSLASIYGVVSTDPASAGIVETSKEQFLVEGTGIALEDDLRLFVMFQTGTAPATHIALTSCTSQILWKITSESLAQSEETNLCTDGPTYDLVHMSTSGSYSFYREVVDGASAFSSMLLLDIDSNRTVLSDERLVESASEVTFNFTGKVTHTLEVTTESSDFMWSILNWDTDQVVLEGSAAASLSSGGDTSEFSLTLEAGMYVIRWFNVLEMSLWTARGDLVHHVELGFLTDGDGTCGMRPFTVGYSSIMRDVFWVNACEDDAVEHTNSGHVESTAEYLLLGDNPEFAREFGSYGQITGLRFEDLRIPQGSTIRSAHARFRAAELSWKARALSLLIRGERGVSHLFSGLKADLSSRSFTNTNATWHPGVLISGEMYETVELAEIVQELVGEDTWEFGLPLSLFLQGNGTGGIVSRDSGGKSSSASMFEPVSITSEQCALKWDAPALVIEYTPAESEEVTHDVCGETTDCACGVPCADDGTCACELATDSDGSEVILLGDRCEIPFRSSSDNHDVTAFLVNVARDDVDDIGAGCVYVTHADRSGGPSCTLRGALHRANSIVEQESSGHIVLVIVSERRTPTIYLTEQIKVQGSGELTSGGSFGNAIFLTGSPGNYTLFNSTLEEGLHDVGDDIKSPRGMPVIVGPRFDRHFYVQNVYLHISNLVFRNGFAPSNLGIAGSIYVTSATLFIRNSWFRLNRANWVGGAVLAATDATVAVSNSRFSTNSAQTYGSGICVYDGSVLVEDSELDCNFGSGVIYQYGSRSTTYDSSLEFGDSGFALVRRSSFERNDGGGIVSMGQMLVEASNFTNNVGLYGGGASCNRGVLVVNNSAFTNNTAQRGGGIFAEECTVFANGVTFESNRAMAGGGISVVDGSELVVTDSTFDSNVASEENYMSLEYNKETMGCGGGICVGKKDSQDSDCSLSVIGSYFHNNEDTLSRASAVPGKDKYHASICADSDYDLRTTILDPADTRDMSVDQHFPTCDSNTCAEGCLDLDGSPEDHGMFGVLCECERRTSCEMTPFELARLETLAMDDFTPATATLRYLKLDSSIANPPVDLFYAHMEGCGEVKWEVSLPSNVTWLSVSPSGWMFELNRHQCEEQGSGLDEYQSIELSFFVAGLASGFYETQVVINYELYNPTKMEYFPDSQYFINVHLDLYTPIEPLNSLFSGPYRVETFDLADAEVFMSPLGDLTYEEMSGNYAVHGDLVMYILEAFDCEGLRESGESEVFFDMTENNATKVVSTRSYGDGTYASFFRAPVRPFAVRVRSVYRDEHGEEVEVELHEYEETAIECASGYKWSGTQCVEKGSSSMSPQLIAIIVLLSASVVVIIHVIRKKADIARRMLMKLMKDTFIIILSLFADAIDVFTDVLAFYAVQSDDSLKSFHLPYQILVCLSLAVSATSLTVSSRVLYRMSHKNSFVVPLAEPVQLPADDAKGGSSNTLGPHTPRFSSDSRHVLATSRSITRLQAESLLQSSYGPVEAEDTEMDLELYSEIRHIRDNMQRNYMKLIVAVVEDIPMLIINFLVELSTDESSKLEVRLSMLFSCFMMGFKSNALLNIRRLRSQLKVLEGYAAHRAAQMQAQTQVKRFISEA